jgi:hypothetical protein
MLQWATYQDASDQTSLSRIWGGIHPPIDDIKGRIIGDKIGKQTFTLAKQYFSGTLSLQDISIDKNYYIMPSEYFINKTASNANLIMPQKLEGEDIFTYIKRAKKLVKTNDQLPSSITGKTVETLDLSDLNIVPTFGD